MMKRMMTLTLALAVMMLALSFAAAETEVYYAIGETPVRVANDGMSEIMAFIPDGAEINMLFVLGDWVAVAVPEGYGYVHVSNVTGLADETPADPAAPPEMKVTIFTSRRTVMSPGETVTLTSLLEGFDGYDVAFQWQCDKGFGFQDVSGATADTYQFTADLETLSWSWMLLVTAYPIQ